MMKTLLRLLPELQNVADLLRLRVGESVGFTGRYRGMLVLQDRGVWLDQPLVAAVVDEVAAELVEAGRKGVGKALARVTLRFTVGPPEPGVMAVARWEGGWTDRGRIELQVGPGWEERLRGTLVALLDAELPAA